MATEKRGQNSRNRRKSSRGIEVRVTGTSPLSFDVIPGNILFVREFAPSLHNRPTIGSGFKSSGYLLFHDETKVGRLSPESVSRLGKRVPKTCTVSEVNRDRKVLRVVFN